MDVSNELNQFQTITMEFDEDEVGSATIVFGSNQDFNSSTTWATQLRETIEIIEHGSRIIKSDTTIPYIARLMGGMAISNVIEILGETNALNEVAIELLGLVKDADEPRGSQRQDEVISISRWSDTIGGIAMVLDILKDAGITVQASADASQILRQLQLELKRMQIRNKKDKRQTLHNSDTNGDPGGRASGMVLNNLVPTDTSSLIARSTMIETEDFIDGKGKINAKIFLGLLKMSELAPRMMAIDNIEVNDKDAAKALLTVSVGAANNWGEVFHFLLIAASYEGGPVCFDDMETFMAVTLMLDKLIHKFDLVSVPAGGFMEMLELAKKRVHMRVPYRTRNLFLAFTFMIYKATTQNRACMAADKKLSGSSWDTIISEHEHDVRIIGEGGLSFRLQPGLSMCQKWTQKMRKADLLQGNHEEKDGIGCRDFLLRNKCPRGIQCKLVHSDQAKCSYGPTCKFLASDKGCIFKGPDSHSP